MCGAGVEGRGGGGRFFPDFFPSPYTDRRQNLLRMYQALEMPTSPRRPPPTSPLLALKPRPRPPGAVTTRTFTRAGARPPP